MIALFTFKALTLWTAFAAFVALAGLFLRHILAKGGGHE
jgi:hypothetical protein